jgi:murein DD-endopeptidase MepM/ murein hydrolase activator NlpD
MIRFRGFLLAAFLGCATVVAAQPAGWVIVPANPQPGDIVRVTVPLPSGQKSGEIEIAGRTFPGIETGGLLTAYVGLDLDLDPGEYPVRFDHADGKKASWPVEVRTKEWATESLKVNPKYTDLDKETLDRVWAEKQELKKIFATTTKERYWKKAFVLPAEGKMGSPFGLRRFFNDQPRNPHSGVDIKAPTGTKVYASNAGKVMLAKDLFFTGNTVVIDHGFGMHTIYAHLSKLDCEAGEMVERSQLIGLVGATGRVTGPHLHWAAKLGGARVDPKMLPGISL